MFYKSFSLYYLIFIIRIYEFTGTIYKSLDSTKRKPPTKNVLATIYGIVKIDNTTDLFPVNRFNIRIEIIKFSAFLLVLLLKDMTSIRYTE